MNLECWYFYNKINYKEQTTFIGNNPVLDFTRQNKDKQFHDFKNDNRED